MAIIITNPPGSGGGGGGPVAWADVTSKPATFPPESHSHPTSDVTGLDAALAAKQDTLTAGTNITIVGGVIAADTPAWDDVTDKPAEFPAEAHTHDTSDIDDFSLDAPPANRDTLFWNESLNKWVNDAITLSDLGDTTEITGSDNDFLVYKTGDEWTNRTAAEARSDIGLATGGILVEYDEPVDGTKVIAQYMPFAGTINSFVHATASGTVSVTIKINGTNVTGLVTSASSSVETNATATAANTFTVGDTISIEFASAASPVDFRGTLIYTR